MLLTLARVFVLLSIAFSFLFSASAVAQKMGQSDPLTISENRLYVTVHINGRGPYRFLLDTGLPDVGRIDYRVAKALQLNIVGYQENSDAIQVKRDILVAVNQLSVGAVTHSSLRLVASDFNTTPRSIPVDGIIGRDFFRDYLLTIDGPSRRLIVSRDRLDTHAKGVLSYPKPFVITGKAGQTNLYISLEMGSPFGFQFPTYLLAGLHYTNTAHKSIVTMANLTFETQEAMLTDALVLGAITVTGQMIYYSGKTHQISVGVDFLKEHILTIDQRNKLVRIE